MTTITQIPEGLRHTLSWKTNIIRSYDGTEQRIAVRRNPRQSFAASYLEDSDEGIQFWKYALTFELAGLLWRFPVWGDMLQTTVDIVGGATSFNCDFSLTDTQLGEGAILIHPDGSSEQVLGNVATRTDTTMTLSSGTIIADYPAGSFWVPVEGVWIRQNPGYVENVAATAVVSVIVDQKIHRVIAGYGATPLVIYQGRPVLDRQPDFTGANESFAQKIDRSDYGGQVRQSSGEIRSHSILTKLYRYTTDAQRQWWKLFLSTVRGRQGSFYTSTYRNDLSLVSQPVQGAATIIVDEAANVVDGWENLSGHQDLAISTADGDVQHVRIDTAGTADNGDGTHTVEFLPALTNTALGSTIEKISFFELVVLASDDVFFDYKIAHNEVTISTRTVQA